jgi:hypothetical protein
MKITNLMQITALALATAWGQSQAWAIVGDVKLQYSTVGGVGGSSFTLDLDHNGSYESSSGGSWAGALQFTVTDGSLPGNGLGSTLRSVCTDVLGVLGQNKWYDVQAFAGNDGLKPDWGYNLADAANGIQNAAHVFFNVKGYLDTGTDAQKAAVQLAVWEALYDTGRPGGYGFANGEFRATGNVTASATGIALGWLNTYQRPANVLYAGSLLVPLTSQNGLVDVNAQELLWNVTPVPEPATVIAGSLLLLPFGASTIRFIRKNRKA